MDLNSSSCHAKRKLKFPTEPDSRWKDEIYVSDSLAFASMSQYFDQTNFYALRWCLTQSTHKEPVAEKRSQINFRPKTVFITSSLRKSSPLEAFGIQTVSQDTFALLAEFGLPLHRKTLHKLSTLSTQPLRNSKNWSPKVKHTVWNWMNQLQPPSKWQIPDCPRGILHPYMIDQGLIIRRSQL